MVFLVIETLTPSKPNSLPWRCGAPGKRPEAAAAAPPCRRALPAMPARLPA